MKILLTGATGFIGQNVVKELLKKKYEVTCIIRNNNKISNFSWYKKVRFIECDIQKSKLKIDQEIPKTLIHLAWSGLPNYESMHHLKKNLPFEKSFLNYMISKGIERIIVSGTCFEFGNQNGALSPMDKTDPVFPYAIAKDNLRKWLEKLSENNEFILKWVRLFYMYGESQTSRSIIGQLDQAINNGQSVFKMSLGEQLRDYLDVKEVARYLVKQINNKSKNKIIHCCSGKPISIRRLVENHIKKRGSKIKLELGFYPYSKIEPMAFWGLKK